MHSVTGHGTVAKIKLHLRLTTKIKTTINQPYHFLTRYLSFLQTFFQISSCVTLSHSTYSLLEKDLGGADFARSFFGVHFEWYKLED